MTQKKTIRQRNLISADTIARWTDEEVLTNIYTLLDRAKITTDYVTEQVDDTSAPIIVAEVMTIMCGDKVVYSEPRQLDWPLQQMPMPNAFKALLN